MVYIRLRRYDPATGKDVKEKRIPTNIRVKPRNWSSKKGEVLKGDFNYQQKNRLIKDKESQISSYIHTPDLDYKMAQLSREEFLIIEEVFPSKKLLKYKKSLFDYIDEYYNRRKKLGHPHGTIKEFKTVMNRIKRFDYIKRIRPENIESGFLIFTPKKTERFDVEVEQPLNRYAKELLEEVNNDTSCYKMTNQAYNR